MVDEPTESTRLRHSSPQSRHSLGFVLEVLHLAFVIRSLVRPVDELLVKQAMGSRQPGTHIGFRCRQLGSLCINHVGRGGGREAA